MIPVETSTTPYWRGTETSLYRILIITQFPGRVKCSLLTKKVQIPDNILSVATISVLPSASFLPAEKDSLYPFPYQSVSSLFNKLIKPVRRQQDQACGKNEIKGDRQLGASSIKLEIEPAGK